MQYTAGQAAKSAGVSTATITRAIKRGRLSASKDDNGSWRIDPAELHRVYPDARAQDGTTLAGKSNATPMQDSDLRHEVGILEERLKAAEALRSMAEELRAAAEQDRDAWRDQAERLTKALPAPVIGAAQPERRRWWSRR